MEETIPVFIINRNLLTWPKTMVQWLKQIPYLEPIIFDNASTYPPLIEWYQTKPCEIIPVPINTGHTGLWATGIIQNLQSNYYIIADPDFDLSGVKLDVIDKLKEGLKRFTSYGKVGLAISIDDLPDGFPGKQDIIKWESKYWEFPLGDDFYLAEIDTTFALYDSKRLKHYTYDAIRVGGPYVAKHIPWYLTKDNMNKEFVYYCQHNEGPSNVCYYCQNIIQEFKNK